MSFVRRDRESSGADALRGVKASVRGGGGRITSSGIADLDELLGGGLGLGSVLSYTEVGDTGHINAFVACFIAQGIAHDHAVAIAAADDRPENVLNAIPAAMTGGRTREPAETNEDSGAGDEHLKIAWRYRRQPKDNASSSRPMKDSFATAFDLSKAGHVDVTKKKVSLLGYGTSVQLDDVLDNLVLHLKAADRAKVPARIVVRALDCILWRGSAERFLRRLRGVVRGQNAVCLVTMSEHASASTTHLTDTRIILDTNKGQGTKSLGLGDYLATLVVKRSQSPFSLHCDRALSRPHVVFRGRRSYHIEEAHSAPDETEITSFESGKSLACAPGPPGATTNIDF